MVEKVYCNGDPVIKNRVAFFCSLINLRYCKRQFIIFGYSSMRRLTFIFLFCSPLLVLSAQNLSGVWEGRLNMREDGDKGMRVRLELLQSEGSWFGILYTRGVEKGTVYGCDYFVTGAPVNGRIDFKWQKVQRSIAIKESDCQALQLILLVYKQRDSSSMLQGNWVWKNGNTDVMSCVKVAESISPMAEDEIKGYISNIYEWYETAGIRLPMQDRFIKNVLNLEVDSSDVVLELSTIDSSKHDSIAVYVNGNPVAELQDLLQMPLRLRFKELPKGINDLLIVSQSVVQKRINIRMKFIWQGEIITRIIQPGFTTNVLIELTRKTE